MCDAPVAAGTGGTGAVGSPVGRHSTVITRRRPLEMQRLEPAVESAPSLQLSICQERFSSQAAQGERAWEARAAG